MVRVSVPEAHADEYGYVGGPAHSASVGPEMPRSLVIREDDDGHYVGAPEHHADAVAEWLRDEYDADVTVEDTARSESESESEAEDAEAGSPSDLLDKGECPWCDDYEGDAVPQHASSAHPDEWAAYKED